MFLRTRSRLSHREETDADNEETRGERSARERVCQRDLATAATDGGSSLAPQEGKEGDASLHESQEWTDWTSRDREAD